MLKAAKDELPHKQFSCSVGSDLPFKDKEFDLTYSITVLQHIPPDGQKRAAKEIMRVTKTSGEIVIMEDILKRESPSAFMHANSPEEWISMFEQLGGKLVQYRYDKYFIFYTFYKYLKKMLNKIGIRADDNFFEKLFYYPSLLEPYCYFMLPRNLASGICLKFLKK